MIHEPIPQWNILGIPRVFPQWTSSGAVQSWAAQESSAACHDDRTLQMMPEIVEGGRSLNNVGNPMPYTYLLRNVLYIPTRKMVMTWGWFILGLSTLICWFFLDVLMGMHSWSGSSQLGRIGYQWVQSWRRLGWSSWLHVRHVTVGPFWP